MLQQTLGNYRISRFIKQNSREYREWNQGEPDAVVFETTTGSIITIRNDSQNFDQAWALYDEWMAVNGGLDGLL